MQHLRPHQERQLKFLEKNRVALISACCGSGKSVTQLSAIEHFQATLAVIVVPWLVLTEQLVRDYFNGISLPFLHKYRWLLVSSVGGTTDSEQVQSFLATGGGRIVIATYMSLKVAHAALEQQGARPDVVCFDEAHHMVEQHKEATVKRVAALSARALYFTATPSERMRQSIGSDLQEFTYTLPEAIRDGVCNTWELAVMMVSDERRRMSVLEATAMAYFKTLNGRILLKCGLANGSRGRQTRATDFDQTRARRAFRRIRQEFFPGSPMPTVRLKSFTADMRPEQRDRILKQEFDLTSDKAVYLLAFCDTLSEGVDTRRANMVVIVDEVKSQVGLVQLIGRVQRKPYMEEVPMGTVVRLAYLSQREYEEADDHLRGLLLRRDVGDSLGHMVAALKSQDVDLAEQLWRYAAPQETAPRGDIGRDRGGRDNVGDNNVPAPPQEPRITFDDSLLCMSLRQVGLPSKAGLVVVDAVGLVDAGRRRTKQAVSWLCEHYADGPPRQSEASTIAMPCGKEVQWAAGRFLDHIRPNWLPGERPNTRLTPDDKARIEALFWFPEWHEAVLARHRCRVNVKRDVSILCELWPGETPPRQRHPQLVPERLLAAGEAPRSFDGGKFLDRVKPNFVGRRANTALEPEDMQRLRGLPWFQFRERSWVLGKKCARGRCGPPSTATASGRAPRAASRAASSPLTASGGTPSLAAGCAEAGRGAARLAAELRGRRLRSRARAERLARRLLAARAGANQQVEGGDVLRVLRCWQFRRNKVRRNVMPEGAAYVPSDTLGLTRSRSTQRFFLARASSEYPAVTRLLCRWLGGRSPPELRGADFAYTSISVNGSYAAKRHRDARNAGASVVKAFGEFTGGRLGYWPGDVSAGKRPRVEKLPVEGRVTLNVRDSMVLFDGNRAHEVEAFEGERYSIVFFTLSAYGRVPARLRRSFEKLGGQFPTPEFFTHTEELLSGARAASGGATGLAQWPDAQYAQHAQHAAGAERAARPRRPSARRPRWRALPLGRSPPGPSR